MSKKGKKNGHRTLRGSGEIRRFLRTNATPVWFVSRSPLPLLGLDRWVRRFRYVCEIDPFAGRHPAVVARVGSRGAGVVITLNGEGATEGPTTHSPQLGAADGISLAPRVLGRASSYGVLQALAVRAGLGRDLAVRARSGQTVSISSEQDWLEHEHALAGEELTVIKRVRGHRLTAVAVVTRHGTLVGPTLAATAAGGRGQETGDLPDEQHRSARRIAELVGERLRREAYRGWLEVELVAEAETDAVYLERLQTGLTRASSLANVAAVARDELPLFAFHLLELLDVEVEVDVATLNAAWAQADVADAWSIVTIEDETSDEEPIASAPRTGLWRLEEEGVRFVRRELDWRGVAGDHEAFYLRLARKNDVRRPGAELGAVVAHGRLDDGRAHAWADGLAGQYRTAAVGTGV